MVSRLAVCSALLLAPVAAQARPLLKPLSLSVDEYGESFSFIADLEDSTYLLLQLGITNIGPGSGNGVCRVLVVPPSGKPWSANTLVRSSQWRYRGGPERERLEVGPCWLNIEADLTTVHVALDGGTAELKIPGRPQPLRPPGSWTKVEGRQHRLEIWFPGVTAEATLEPPDQKRRVVSGGAYGDHAASDIAPTRLARRWIRFRALNDPARPMLLIREGLDGAITAAWLRRSGSFEALSDPSLQRSGAKDAPQFEVKVGKPGGGSLVLQGLRPLYRLAPVEELGVLGTVVAPFVGSPVTYTSRGNLRDGDQTIEGVFEIEMAKDE